MRRRKLTVPRSGSYLFEHIWRQVREKFYVKDLRGVDWDYYKKVYEKFLAYSWITAIFGDG
jgi:tricorn protease